MHALLNDLTMATRSLRRSRGFVVITVLSLGVALGVTTTMFGVVDAALNPVVPIREPARVVVVSNDGDGASHGVRWRDKLEAMRRAPGVFDDATGVAPSFLFIRIGHHFDRQTVMEVGPTFFDVTGVQPVLGTTVARDQSIESPSSPAAMISFQLWRAALGGRRDLQQATVEIEGTIYRVVGVLPPNMPGSLNAGVVVPMPPSGPTGGWVPLLARLSTGVDAARAQATLRTVVDPALTAAFGTGRYPFRYSIRPVVQDRPDEMSDLHRILLASAFVILIIAFANLANLMVARGLARQRDYALCLALGARRINLIRRTLLEGLICALGGAALGVLIAVWAFDIAAYRMTREVPGLGAMAVSLNWRVFTFAVLAATATSLAFAIVPALRTSSVNLDLPLKSGAGTTTGRVHSRFSFLVVTEVA